jgi:hypothetical protein
MPGERAPGTHWIGGWVDPSAGLDNWEKRKFLILPGLELWPLSVLQLIASRYTGCATPAPLEFTYNILENKFTLTEY